MLLIAYSNGLEKVQDYRNNNHGVVMHDRLFIEIIMIMSIGVLCIHGLNMIDLNKALLIHLLCAIA